MTIMPHQPAFDEHAQIRNFWYRKEFVQAIDYSEKNIQSQ
jgi:hypothetical protein